MLRLAAKRLRVHVMRAARAVGLDEHAVVKTLITEDDRTRPMIDGTSAFGTRKAMSVYMERSIADLPCVYVNGGRRGYLVGLAPADLVRVLQPVLVDIAVGA